ncbi:hypothetical protein JRO89_XS03G0058400 [Xanthoceras sorbifolium]|uniref:Polygalacturonase n=1 Tax=Xanthoceras sorbifolium TaxID=99658 RepID=A0ABQ8I8U1_9ROSI|nr:hypothetical protein JRO89_XS03G0058400 [Xanthoceras sorbifolium]
MGLLMVFVRVLFLILVMLQMGTNAKIQQKVFDVTRYGAIADGRTNNTKAFERAWSDACKWNGKRTLKAPSNPSVMTSDQWISFQYVNRLAVNGGGSFDGQGASSWKNVIKNSSNFLPIQRENISPTRQPPHRWYLRISRSSIGTGGDCIAILSGSSNIDVSEVFCGPGHGISIGSLRKYAYEKNVWGFSVKNCTFRDTTNGLRIKTYRSSASSVSGINYQNIHMDNVQNPIIIDQQYCPYPPCVMFPSLVQIKDVTYSNIWGTSSTKVAVTFRCSERFPCKNIMLNDINLVHHGPGGSATSQCSYVNGASSGRQMPPSCL